MMFRRLITTWVRRIRRRPAPVQHNRRPFLQLLEWRFAPAVLMVTTNADDGDGSLRRVLSQAQDGDTIQFAIQNQVITLTTGEIATGKSVTIDGQNNNITIDGNNQGRIFDFSGSGLSETVKNLTFKNGNQQGGNGGAIYDEGTLTLDHDTFLSSFADRGGAVYNATTKFDTVQVMNCNFRSDEANISGGAFYAGGDADVTLTNTAFTEDTAVQSGGAVCVEASAWANLRVNSCDFTNNMVTGTGADHIYYGGAIYTDDTLYVTGGHYIGNSARDGGGAIYYTTPSSGGSSMTLTNVTFTNNSAEQGGAVDSSVNTIAGQVTVTVTGCLFNLNRATGPVEDQWRCAGGAFFAYHTSGAGSISLSISNSTFYQNSSDWDGGAIWMWLQRNGDGLNTATLTSLTVYQNQAGDSGGGLWIMTLPNPDTDPSWVKLGNSIIAGNGIENPPSLGNDIYGKVASQGFNLIGQVDAEASEGSTWRSNDIKGDSVNPVDPGLDPNGLQNNGGPTDTIKLLTTSRAYRAGDPNLAGTTDQRGFTRQTGTVSIGAYDPDAVFVR